MQAGRLRRSKRRNRSEHTGEPRAELIEWVEKQGLDSIRARYATAEVIAREAQTTLTVLLAGVGGSAAYATKLLEPGPPEPLTIAAAAVCGYLAALSAILVFACMRFESFPAQFQEPTNLLVDAPFLKIRESELRNLDARIKQATAINARKARNLNNIRLMAIFSVVVFLAVSVVAPRPTAATPGSLTIRCTPDAAASAPAGGLSCRLGA